MLNQLKIAGVVILVIAALGLGFKVYQAGQAEATARQTIERLNERVDDLNDTITNLENNLNQKDALIESQRRIMDLQSFAIAERDAEVNELNDRLNGIDVNTLGDDLDDLAPDSVRELFRRLNNE